MYTKECKGIRERCKASAFPKQVREHHSTTRHGEQRRISAELQLGEFWCENGMDD